MYYNDHFRDPRRNVDNGAPFTETHKRLHAGDATELINKINSFNEYIDFESYYNNTYKGNPLHHAIRCNNVNVAKILILKGADVNKVDYFLLSPIYYALKEDNEEMVSLLLNNNVPARGTYNTGKKQTYFFEYVCKNSSLKIVKLFLSRGCSANEFFIINEFNCQRICRPLHAAIMSNKLEIVKLLISWGANVNDKNLLDETPLYLACMEGLIDIAEILLEHNALINVITKKNNKTPFYHAIKSCDPHLVKLLLENGAIIDNHDPKVVSNICNPLHLVIKNGGVKIVQYLLEAGLNPDLRASLDNVYETNRDYDEGSTLLHTAVASRNIEIIELLLQYNADVYIQNKMGYIPLHTATEMAKKDIIELLLAADPKIKDSVNESTINMQDSSGYTPLHLACLSQSTECMQLLIDSGADLNAESYNGDTIIHLATAFNCFRILERLVESQVPLNVLNNDLNSPLHLAVWKRSPKTIELLLKNRAETVYENEDYLTPLEVALKHRHQADITVIAHLLRYTRDINDRYHRRAFRLALTEMIDKDMSIQVFDLFFKYGYILDQEDEDLDSLLFLAAKNGHTTIVKMLLDLGANPNTTVDMETVLHVTAKHKKSETISMLLKYGADARLTNDEGKLAVYCAVSNSDPESFDLLLHSVDDNAFPGLLQYVVNKCPLQCAEFIRILVDRGADPNAYYGGRNILHYLISSLQSQPSRIMSRFKAITYVLDKGVDIDATTSTGLTALHLTAESKNPEIVKTLLDYGAYVDPKANDGTTPLILHCIARAFTCIEILLDYNADIHARSSSGSMAIDILLDSVHKDEFHYYEQWLGKVMDMCDMHVAKLKLAGLYVHPEVMKRLRRPPQVDLEKRCQDELEQLKQMKLNTYVSGYDFLVRNLTDVARFIRDDEVQTYIKAEISSNKYPLYRNFMVSQLTRVKKRDPYLARAEKVLSQMYEKGLPDICTANITGYLAPEDLRNLANCDKFTSSNSKVVVVNDGNLYSFVANMFHRLTSTIWRLARSFTGLFQRRV